LAELDPALGHAEPDPEIQDLIAASGGLNLALDFLPGSLPLDAGAAAALDPALAASIVWLDALAMNVDRTPRNPNLLLWHGRVWLIDHGAALYVQHRPEPLPEQPRRAFPAIADHVLLPYAAPIGDVDAELAAALTPERLHAIAAQIPPDWLPGGPAAEAYAEFLLARLAGPRDFAEEAERARTGA
ncbi:MAG TPA: aminotransferase class I and II, partial [Solirubrobacteraceae bacterium]